MPILWQIVLLLVVTVFVAVGQTYLPVGVLVVAGVAAVTTALIRNWHRALLAGFTLLVVVVRLQEREGQQSGVTLIDMLTGVVILASLGLVVSRALVNREPLSRYWGMHLLFAYLVWGIIGATISIADGNTTLNVAFREFLDFSPLIVFPVLMVPIARRIPNFERSSFRLLLVLWAIIQVAGFLRIRSTVAAATYLFETGFSHYDIVNSGLMCLLFSGLAALNRNRRYQPVYVLAILASIGGLLMTFNRTTWVAVTLCIPVLLLLTPTDENRRRVTRVWIGVGMILTVGAIIGSLTTPMGRILIEFLGSRIASASKVNSDASLVNRYIEWRYVLHQISSNPIMGLGFGGGFKIYVWVAGVSTMSHYTHNGLLIVLVKSGIVGTICFFGSYFGFIWLGITLRRSGLSTIRERTFVTVGLVSLLVITIVATTIGLILHREVLLYVGIIWGYLLVVRDRIAGRKAELDSPEHHNQAS